MKNVIAIIFLVVTHSVVAQKIVTEGTIKYNVEMSGISDPQAQAMMQNMKMSIFVKNEKFATEMDMGMMKTKTIKTTDNKFVTLMDMMGQKIKYTMDEKQFEDKKLKDDSYEVTITADKKIIAGYNCKKAIIKTKDGKSFFAYFTNELSMGGKSDYNGPYNKIDGLMMEYSMEKNGATMTMSCTEINLNSISDDVFAIPTSGYTEMSLDQIMKMGGM